MNIGNPLTPEKIEQIYNNYKNGRVGITEIHYYYKDRQLQETASYIKALKNELAIQKKISKKRLEKINVSKKSGDILQCKDDKKGR
jgi:hypothetical protein